MGVPSTISQRICFVVTPSLESSGPLYVPPTGAVWDSMSAARVRICSWPYAVLLPLTGARTPATQLDSNHPTACSIWLSEPSMERPRAQLLCASAAAAARPPALARRRLPRWPATSTDRSFPNRCPAFHLCVALCHLPLPADHSCPLPTRTSLRCFRHTHLVLVNGSYHHSQHYIIKQVAAPARPPLFPKL